MSQSSLISVVITTKNRLENLKKCIDCLVRQLMLPKELVIVNDGGSSIFSVVANIKQKTNLNIKLIELKTSVGVSVARNIGVEAATGEYISFCDDDDEFFVEKIQTVHDYIISKSYPDLICHGIRTIYVDENMSVNSWPKIQKLLGKEILIGNCIGGVSRVICKKSFIVNAGMFDARLKSLEDWDLWIRFVLQGARLEFCNQILVNYIVRTSQNSLSRDMDQFEHCYKLITDKYFEEISKLRKDELNRRVATAQMTRFRIKLLSGASPLQLAKNAAGTFIEYPSVCTFGLIFASVFTLKNLLRLFLWIKR